MKELTKWLERQIELCDELGNMENEKYAFRHTLKKVRSEQLKLNRSSLHVKEKYNTGFEEYVKENYREDGDKFVCKSSGKIEDLNEVLLQWHYEY